MSEVNEDSRHYYVVVNDEEQYSIWPVGRDVPAGWNVVGPGRSREECLAHIGEVWTDMRPKSLRERMSRNENAALSDSASVG